MSFLTRNRDIAVRSGRAWDLGSVPNLAAWYRASRIIGLADSDPVTTWPDLSGNGRDLTQATANMKPLWMATAGPNSTPLVRFDGVNDQMRTASFAYNQPNTIYAVMAQRSSDFKYFFSSLSDFGNALFVSAWYPSMYAGEAHWGADPWATNDFRLFTFIYNSTSSQRYVGGALDVRGTGDAGTQNGNGLVLGDRYDSALPSQSDFSELAIYNRLITPGGAEDVAIRGKLTELYGAL